MPPEFMGISGIAIFDVTTTYLLNVNMTSRTTMERLQPSLQWLKVYGIFRHRYIYRYYWKASIFVNETIYVKRHKYAQSDFCDKNLKKQTDICKQQGTFGHFIDLIIYRERLGEKEGERYPIAKINYTRWRTILARIYLTNFA